MGKLTIVYGGQFGSEGKGQIVAYLAQRNLPDWAVRVGGPNAGHTFLLPNGNKQVVQTIPAPLFISEDVMGVIGAAGLIHEDVFWREVEQAYEIIGKPPWIYLDRSVGIITRAHMRKESMLKGSIGSTGEGVGAATASRVMRDPETVLGHPKHTKRFMEKVTSNPAFRRVQIAPDTALTLNQALRSGDKVVIEGTQGMGLSLCTSGYYPFATSRECTPQGMLAQTGIAIENTAYLEKLMVIRTYPIRVGGTSGDLPGEITWKELKTRTKGYVKEAEITTVTKKKRRIAEIELSALQRAVYVTRPTGIALTFFDYWFPEIATATDPSAFKQKHWDKINWVEQQLDVPIKYISTGFGTVIPLRVTL
jgi:adenylosuccinate synthase